MRQGWDRGRPWGVSWDWRRDVHVISVVRRVELQSWCYYCVDVDMKDEDEFASMFEEDEVEIGIAFQFELSKDLPDATMT